MSESLKKLEKSDGNSIIPPHKKDIGFSKMKIGNIVESLCKPSADYAPQKTIESIKKYIGSGNGRVLYSELTSRIYSMREETVGIMHTNLDSLINYAENKCNEVSDDVYNFIIRLWDHYNLAITQMDNAKNMLSMGVNKSEEGLYNRLLERFKGIEKEYITILGIFASIVLAFTGDMAFSTSVLNNIANSSIYRTVIVALIIGLVLVNILFGLFYYIDKLIGKEKGIKPIIISNVVILMLIAMVSLAWYNGKVEKRNKRIFSPSIKQEVTDVTEDTIVEITEGTIILPTEKTTQTVD